MNKKIFLALSLAGIFMLSSCKPKQSAYKSVYEAAKEKEVDEKDNSFEREKGDLEIHYPAATESVRVEKVTPVYESDAPKLKAYSVVIAAMGMKPNAESLKQRMENAGYSTILVQNEQGMYRVIVGSYDSKDQASAVKSEVLSKFFREGDINTLKAKYGIPFDDWWILQRSY